MVYVRCTEYVPKKDSLMTVVRPVTAGGCLVQVLVLKLHQGTSGCHFRGGSATVGKVSVGRRCLSVGGAYR